MAKISGPRPRTVEATIEAANDNDRGDHEEAEVVIEAKNLLLGLSIVREHFLKIVNVTSSLNVPRSTVKAMAVLGHELVDVDA